MKPVLLAFVCLVSASPFALADSCQDYPNDVGINVEDVAGGTKIVSTGSAEVAVDDAAAVRDARNEATLQAKAQINKFLVEDVKSEDIVNRAVEETKSMQGASKAVARKELVVRVMSLSSKSSGLLRGVVTLGECYTPGSEFRVSVGIKPETIGQAETLSDQNSSGAKAESTDTASQPLNGVGGFSHSDKLKKF